MQGTCFFRLPVVNGQRKALFFKVKSVCGWLVCQPPAHGKGKSFSNYFCVKNLKDKYFRLFFLHLPQKNGEKTEAIAT